MVNQSKIKGPSMNNTANKNNYNDMEEKMRADLDRQVADGRMTQEEADEILNILKNP